MSARDIVQAAHPGAFIIRHASDDVELVTWAGSCLAVSYSAAGCWEQAAREVVA